MNGNGLFDHASKYAAALLSTALALGLGHQEATKTIESGFKGGSAKPRESDKHDKHDRSDMSDGTQTVTLQGARALGKRIIY